jgi:hypothetical protein
LADARSLLRDYWKAPVIAAAASLGLADHIEDEVDGALLAHKLGVDEPSLLRLVGALATLGLIEDRGSGRFALTDEGRTLRSDSPQSIVGMARHVGSMLLPAFLQLGDCVRSGSPPPDIKHGPEGFAALIDNPHDAHIFNQSMVDGSRRIAERAADAYDFSGFRNVMDVGGGYGAVLAVLLKRHPLLQGSILDLPHARRGAEAYLAAEGVADRAAFIEGSFFEPIPTGSDCYLLKYIIHDWNDSYARQIVVHVGDAARGSNATLILIERILPDRFVDDPGHGAAAASDLTMMLWGGRERTEAEFARLFADAGLALTGTTPIGEEHYVIEARSAG